MQRVVFTLIFAFFLAEFTFSQDFENEVLMTIGGQEVTRGEFERIYTKNNQDPAFDKASLDEYMELFINFKLKVIEAEALGMDTLQSFITELKGYRTQLEKPYLTDEKVDEALIKEAYDRMKYDIRASHILIKCDEDATPSDTLKAYKRIEKIRDRAIQGEDFNALARETSEDPSAARNSGDLGFFTAFSMVYPFETAAYNTEVGQISDIISTRFGYHIIKVIDKKPNKGKIRVAHIMRAVPQGSSPAKEKAEQQKINQIYDSIMAGASFVKMVEKYSDDRGSSKKGGELPFFGTGRMIPDFEKAAFALTEIGQVSKPVKTPYGWHIIKLLEKKPLGTFDELKPSLKTRVSKDIRAKKGREKVISNLIKEYHVQINRKNVEAFYNVVDTTIYDGLWNPSKANKLKDVLFTIADTLVVTQQDFANRIGNDGLYRAKKPIPAIVDHEFEKYFRIRLIDFEKSQLETKYPDFKHLLKEYHDGILLFNLTDKMVWTKAVEDTVGLEKFYQENKGKYMWGDRLEATLYSFNNKDFAKYVAKMAKKSAKKHLNLNDQVIKLQQKLQNKDSLFTIHVQKGKFIKGQNEFVDVVSEEPGVKDVQDNGDEFVVVYINRKVSPEPKKLNEARGLITADYQNYLEKQWLAELRAKYKVELNEEVFNKMIK